MAATTIKVQPEARDQLARIAADELGGVSLNSALEYLLTEHRKNAVLAAYARLEADPAQWQDYQAELTEWDATAGDGLGQAGSVGTGGRAGSGGEE